MALITSSLPYPVPTFTCGYAFKTAHDETHEVSIIDIGGSVHITTVLSHLLQPIRCHVGLTVGGGACLHATHMG